MLAEQVLFSPIETRAVASALNWLLLANQLNLSAGTRLEPWGSICRRPISIIMFKEVCDLKEHTTAICGNAV